jgi:hypothetical protein
VPRRTRGIGVLPWGQGRRGPGLCPTGPTPSIALATGSAAPRNVPSAPKHPKHPKHPAGTPPLVQPFPFRPPRPYPCPSVETRRQGSRLGPGLTRADSDGALSRRWRIRQWCPPQRPGGSFDTLWVSNAPRGPPSPPRWRLQHRFEGGRRQLPRRSLANGCVIPPSVPPSVGSYLSSFPCAHPHIRPHPETRPHPHPTRTPVDSGSPVESGSPADSGPPVDSGPPAPQPGPSLTGSGRSAPAAPPPTPTRSP